MQKLQFPKNFLWGAATSAYQVEGNITNNWSEWEKANAERLAREAKEKWPYATLEQFPDMLKPENYISGQACDHFNRFEEDFQLAKNLGHNAHRFSIEWSRVEPREGEFDEDAIEHYRDVILSLKAKGMEPFVTLWHWTNPLWLEKKGGCECKDFPLYFARFAKIMSASLKDEVNFWVTLNEPTSVIANGYLQGNWPPQKKSMRAALKVFKVLSQAHNKAYEAIHKVQVDVEVGFSNIMTYFEPNDPKSFWDKLAVKIGGYYTNEKFLKMTKDKHDFLALQYYFHKKLKFPATVTNENKMVSDMDWEIYPEGIYRLLKWLGEYGLPIYITENGLADAKDEKRGQFIKATLSWVHQAISEGVDVRGYFHWSLLDNFEWDKGFWSQFGLIEVDRTTLQRKVRLSALEYAKICKNNELNLE